VLDEPLCAGDLIRVGDRSRALATIANLTKRIDQNTTLSLTYVPADKPSVVGLLEGAVYFFSRKPRVLEVDTPFFDAAVEGTEFLVRVESQRALLTVFDGRVTARNDQGELTVANGQSLVAEAGQAPAPYVLVRPRDAVQWALFYPIILLPLADRSGMAAREIAGSLGEAVALAGRGEFSAAFAAFEAIPDPDRGAEFYLYRAATLLSVGRVEDARADIDQALARDPTDGRAYALSAVIAVAQNERDRALVDAQRGVELSPRSAAARIALSYAEQAHFRIEAARETMSQAVQDEPENALAWARLSELWLMLGYRERALKAAKKARKLAPELERVETVLGFAALAAIDIGKAKQAFRQAIELNSADPRARFGLGLATIRGGDLEEGRGDIELAVGLDPDDSLLRSYLGKAYFEERTTDPAKYLRELFTNFPNQENTLAAEQYAIAKRLDPNDPTPWLYNAIRLQSENRPVEALRDIETSIELNDNRAVYRSRELLDQDRAARGTSLARIYNDLGFEQLGINQATKSLSLDPANAGAHRFLSDVYLTQPRREIARVSELLQAQLLQDININPVQPQPERDQPQYFCPRRSNPTGIQ
jgi:tetratricopeptide (TPR) repeat protein